MFGLSGIRLAGAIAGAAVLLSLLAWVGWVIVDREHVRAEYATARADLVVARDANTTNLATISALQEALKGWKDTAARQAADAQSAAAASARALQQLARSEAKLKALESKDAGLPACDAFLATDVAKVCPSHAAALVERAGGLP